MLMMPAIPAWNAVQPREELIAAVVADPHHLTIGISECRDLIGRKVVHTQSYPKLTRHRRQSPSVAQLVGMRYTTLGIEYQTPPIAGSHDFCNSSAAQRIRFGRPTSFRPFAGAAGEARRRRFSRRDRRSYKGNLEASCQTSLSALSKNTSRLGGGALVWRVHQGTFLLSRSRRTVERPRARTETEGLCLSDVGNPGASHPAANQV